MGYWAIVEKESRGYHAHFPDVPDINVQAKTIEEIKILLQDALNDYLELLKKENKFIPLGNFNPGSKTTHPKKVPRNVVEYLYITE